MKKENIYEYLGTNGVLQTPINLEGIYKIEKIRLIADSDKKLTKDGIHFYFNIVIPKSELDLWYEV